MCRVVFLRAFTYSLRNAGSLDGRPERLGAGVLMGAGSSDASGGSSVVCD